MTIRQRAEIYTENEFLVKMSHSNTIKSVACDAYIQGATDQRKIDIEKACKWLEDMLALQYATPDFVEEALERLKQTMEDKQ